MKKQRLALKLAVRVYFPRLLVAFAAVFVMYGCARPVLSPSQSAEQFWMAVLAKDVSAAKNFATVDIPDTMDLIDTNWVGGEVTFGDIQFKAQQALVETSLHFQTDNTNISSFYTHLVKQDKRWLVDYKETKKSLQQIRKQHSLNKVIKGLQDLSQDFAGHVDDAIKRLDKAVPEIKDDIESIGNSVADELEGAINKLRPEIKKNIQDLSEALDNAFSDGKKAPKQDNNQSNEGGVEDNEAAESPKGRLI